MTRVYPPAHCAIAMPRYDNPLETLDARRDASCQNFTQNAPETAFVAPTPPKKRQKTTPRGIPPSTPSTPSTPHPHTPKKSEEEEEAEHEPRSQAGSWFRRGMRLRHHENGCFSGKSYSSSTI